MKHTLSFDIDCGETTCASKPGCFCKYLYTKHFGQVPFCNLFQQQLGNSRDDGLGWVLRCPDCLATATKEES